MKKYGKLIAMAVILAAILGVAVFAYQKLQAEANLPSLEEEVKSSETEKKEDVPEDTKEDGTESEKTETSEDPGAKRQEAIDVTFYDSEGKAVKLSDYYGKPVVMNFWATWCGYCKKEMPDFQEVYEEYKDKVEFLFINSTDGSRETREKAETYLQEQGYTIPTFYDEDLDAVYTYSVNSLPTTMLLDKQGRVAAYAPGLVEKEALTSALDALLGEE
ncbi:MAG: TlpA disulfide reductase family protein [Oliverpabstia sp.]|nr:TlpA disulfide reductase family protein [Oliverpabstia sp.]